MGNTNFYSELEGFSNFSDLTSDQFYAAVPDDWSVVIADIVNSTHAILTGRYRDVNTVGAAVVVAVHNLLDEGYFPYAFGGDGATMVIPPDQLERVGRELSRLRMMSEQNFGLTLRVGTVEIAKLNGAPVEVAKNVLAGNRCMAVFRGSGLLKAEKMIRNDPVLYRFSDIAEPSINLQKLSCRWQPIRPRREHSLTLIVQSRGQHAVYGEVVEAIKNVYGGDLENADPINTKGAVYRNVRECIKDERRYHQSVWSKAFLLRVWEILLSVAIFRHHLRGKRLTGEYKESLGRHSDYRKFYNSLKMVVDCSSEQLDELHKILEDLHREGKIFYGTHRSTHTLMTCFFDGFGEGRHIHFIDGGDGGYTMAARELQKQIFSASRKRAVTEESDGNR